MQRKYAHRKKNLNVKLIKSNYLCHGTVIHFTLVILLSSDLETILTQIEMKRQTGKTDRNLFSRLIEQVSCDDQSMYQHLSKCEHYNDIVKLMKLPEPDSTTVAIDKKEYILNAVLSSFRIFRKFFTVVVTGPNYCF